ncbi:hypothetical protein D3C84_1230380 [compost metagenome]
MFPVRVDLMITPCRKNEYISRTNGMRVGVDLNNPLTCEDISENRDFRKLSNVAVISITIINA